MTTYLGKSCSFGLPRVPFVNCRQFMYLVILPLVLRAGYGIWLYQFLIIAYRFTLVMVLFDFSKLCACHRVFFIILSFGQRHNKTNRMTYAPSKDSDQSEQPPSLIRVLAVCSYPMSAQGRRWSDSAEAQADLSLRGVYVSLFVLSCSGLIFVTVFVLFYTALSSPTGWKGDWLLCRLSICMFTIWAASRQNQQNYCTPSQDRSAWACAQSDQSLRCALNG